MDDATNTEKHQTDTHPNTFDILHYPSPISLVSVQVIQPLYVNTVMGSQQLFIAVELKVGYRPPFL